MYNGQKNLKKLKMLKKRMVKTKRFSKVILKWLSLISLIISLSITFNFHHQEIHMPITININYTA